jgi:hypothetical protein
VAVDTEEAVVIEEAVAVAGNAVAARRGTRIAALLLPRGGYQNIAGKSYSA